MDDITVTLIFVIITISLIAATLIFVRSRIRSVTANIIAESILRADDTAEKLDALQMLIDEEGDLEAIEFKVKAPSSDTVESIIFDSDDIRNIRAHDDFVPPSGTASSSGVFEHVIDNMNLPEYLVDQTNITIVEDENEADK